MTWDHIGTFIFASPFVFVLFATLALVFALVRPWRKSRVAVASAVVVLFAGSAGAFTWAGYRNMAVPSEDYPDLLDAYELAPADSQQAMRAVLREAWRRREIFSMSYSQRDRMLAAGGYCRWWEDDACRRIPKGAEAQGIAIEMLGNYATSGSRYASDSCASSRCTGGDSGR